MRGLNGKVAVITGAASPGGLGFAIARRLASEGTKVVLTDRIAAAVANRAAELTAAGSEAISLEQDVAAEVDWRYVLDATIDRFGSLDILINNAGLATYSPIDRITADDWCRQIAVNLTGTFLGCQAAVARMRRNAGGGAIVNMCSGAGIVGVGGAGAYTASKGGVRFFSKSLALEVARDRIRVNSLHPGVFWTDMQATTLRQSGTQPDALVSAIPLGRMGEPDEIAGMAAFLVSDDASYITGADFIVDGGFTAQ